MITDTRAKTLDLLTRIVDELIDDGTIVHYGRDTDQQAFYYADAIARRVGVQPRLPKDGPLATVTSTIGTTARDYSTITSWEADLDNGAVYSAADDAVGECYNDSAFNEAVVINGGGTIGLNSITLTVPSAERHDGTADSGARIKYTGSTVESMLCSVPTGIDVTIEWLEIHHAGAVDNIEVCGGAADNFQVNNCIIHATDASASPPQVKYGLRERISISGQTTRFLSNIIYNIDRQASSDGYALYVPGATSPNLNVCNCTVYNGVNSGSGTTYGVYDNSNVSAGATRDIRNTIAMGSDTDFSTGAGIDTESHNMSADATAAGTGSLTNQTTADQFVSLTAGSEDLHLKSGADAIDAGTDLGTTPSGVEVDIDGRNRDTEGDTWDMGAHEFVAAGGGSIIPQVMHHRRLQGVS